MSELTFVPDPPRRPPVSGPDMLLRFAGDLEAAATLLVETARSIRDAAQGLATLPVVAEQIEMQTFGSPACITVVQSDAATPVASEPREATQEEMQIYRDKRIVACNAKSCRQPVILLLKSQDSKQRVAVEASTVASEDRYFDVELGHVLHADNCKVRHRTKPA